MKCKVCGGAGVIQGQAPGLVSCCPACDGKGFIEQTNEEWFCQLPTEEKAVIFSLLSYRCNICDGTPTNQCHFDRCVRGLKDFIKWLKQPHTEKEETE